MTMDTDDATDRNSAPITPNCMLDISPMNKQEKNGPLTSTGGGYRKFVAVGGGGDSGRRRRELELLELLYER